MAVVIIVLIIITLISIIYGLCYRQQVKSISRQLDFLRNHETNMIVSGTYGRNSITELIDEINNFLSDTAKQKKEYLDKQNNLKSTVTSLSHDIRTPLTSLDGYFQLLSKCDNPAERERYLKIIQNQITCLKDMIEELFTYTKLQNDSYDINLQRCCLNQILLKATFSFYHNFKVSGINPEVDIGDEPLYILGNEVLLIHVFQNIIKNGLEHGQEYFKIQMKRLSNQVSITFINNFSNHNQVDVEQVFDMFYKADSARSHTSTGLGLAIVKELVLRMDGTVTANVSENIFKIIISFKLV